MMKHMISKQFSLNILSALILWMLLIGPILAVEEASEKPNFQDCVNAGDTLNILVLSEAEIKGISPSEVAVEGRGESCDLPVQIVVRL